jgi:hypothetical protein
MASIYDWSKTADDNGSADAICPWPEGMARRQVNNSARGNMKRIAEFRDDISGALASGGSANALTITPNSDFGSLDNGRIIAFRASLSNTAAATLNVNGLGAKNIRKMSPSGDVAVVANDIRINGLYIVMYSTALDGGTGAWCLLNPPLASTPVTVQTFTANGTWTKPAGCRKIVVEAIGGGGGGGGAATSGGGNAAAASGGASGFYGISDPIDVTGVSSGAVVIGGGGNGATAGANNGSAGGNTTITISPTTYTWGGGNGGVAGTAAGDTAKMLSNSGSPTGTNVRGGGERGFAGFIAAPGNHAVGGEGGSGPYGQGGAASRLVAAGLSTGDAATGTHYGAGGGGACTVNFGTPAAGGAGADGFMRVWEHY